MPISVHCRGSRSPLAQVVRIEQGFAQLPDVVLTDDPMAADLIYANDPTGYGVAQRKEGSKLIYNVLDVPDHLLPPAGDFTFEKLRGLNTELRRADAVTAISQFTQGQVQHYFALPSFVVYNPIKSVSPDKRNRGERPFPYRVLLGGRLNDNNKRIRQLAIPALMMAGFDEKDVAIVGGEYPGWGTNLGVVADETLNDLYNSVDFTVSCTLNTGLELCGIESMVCGAIPILTWDTSTFNELPYPRHWGCYPSPTALAYRLRILMENPNIFQADRHYCSTLSDSLRDSFSGKTVAQRILDVYKEISK